MIIRTDDTRLYENGFPLKGKALEEILEKKKKEEAHNQALYGDKPKKDNFVKTKDQKRIEALENQLKKERAGNEDFKNEMKKEIAEMKKGKK